MAKKEYICQNCEKKYKSYNKNSRFCSLSCTTKYYNKKRKGYRDVETICECCGKQFKIRQSDINKHKKKGFKKYYCSRECSAKDKIGSKRPNTSESLIKAHIEGRAKPRKFTNGGFRQDLGKYFRSSWEANYARMLKYLQKKWQYEPQTFVLDIDGKKTTYTPDFYLEDEKTYVEIKGFWYNELEKKKFETFSKTHDIMLIDFNKYLEIQSDFLNKIFWENKPSVPMTIKLVSEIGINHNHDMEVIKKLIEYTKEYKWDIVKFQKRTIEKVIPKNMWYIKKETPWGIIDYIDYKKKLELGEIEYDKIDYLCNQIGIDWFASAWDIDSQLFLDKYDLKYNKIASPMLTYKPLLEHVSKQRKITLISTGMSTDKQIDDAVNIFKNNECPFVLMHCVGLYPCPLEQLDLYRIVTLRNRYSCRVGYSGHSEGAMDAILAAALGAEYIEKHVTLNRAMFGSDQSASIEPGGMEFISKHVHHIPKMLGTGKRQISEQEEKIANKMRYWEK